MDDAADVTSSRVPLSDGEQVERCKGNIARRQGSVRAASGSDLMYRAASGSDRMYRAASGSDRTRPNPKRKRGVRQSSERKRPDAVASPLVGDDPSRDRQGVVLLNP